MIRMKCVIILSVVLTVAYASGPGYPTIDPSGRYKDPRYSHCEGYGNNYMIITCNRCNRRTYYKSCKYTFGMSSSPLFPFCFILHVCFTKPSKSKSIHHYCIRWKLYQQRIHL